MVSYFFTLPLFLLAVLTPVSNGRRSNIHRHFHHPNEDTRNEIDDDERRMVLLHSQRVTEAASCEIPKEQVIHITDHYPGKYYLPHCTVLHRCGKHAGCCGTNTLRCVAAEKQKVTLYFYSVKINEGKLEERKVEKLAFTNHTRCACAPITHIPKHDL